MIRDVLVALLLAAVFVTVLYPFFLRIKIGIETHFHLKKPSTLRPAFIVTFLFVLTVFTPVSFMVLWAVKTVFSLVKGIQIENLDVEHFNLWSAEIWSNLPESLRSVFDRLMSFVDMETLKPYASDVSKSLLMTLSNLLSTFMSSIPSLLLSTFFFLLGMFYFLADSEKIMRIFNRIRTKSGVSEDVVHRLLLKWRGLSRGVLVAGLASGLFQAFVFSLMMLLVGPREYALLTFALVFIFSFVPLF
jgi:predicted PurR-regulated permease PerM